MLNRLTVSTLLKAVIIFTALFIFLGVSLSAWESWQRLRLTNRIAVIAEASANMFRAMDRLRSDRSTTNRLVNTDQMLEPDMDRYLRGLRDAEMPAMSRALELLPTLAIERQQAELADFNRLFK